MRGWQQGTCLVCGKEGREGGGGREGIGRGKGV